MVRPRAVTVISWLAIVFGLCSLLPKIFALVSSETYHLLFELMAAMSSDALVELPVEAYLAHALIGSAVWIVAGWYMLKGKNWARLLAILWGSTVLIATFLIARFSPAFLMKSAMYLIGLYFLTRPRCLRYFRGQTPGPGVGEIGP